MSKGKINRNKYIISKQFKENNELIKLNLNVNKWMTDMSHILNGLFIVFDALNDFCQPCSSIFNESHSNRDVQ